MKKYFGLTETAEDKVIGTYPQLIDMIDGYDYDAFNSVNNLQIYRGVEPPFLNPNLDGFKATKGAKITDIMSGPIGGRGFILNDKLKSIFEKFKIPKHYFFKANVYHKINCYDNYFWFHLVSDFRHFVNYNSSLFFKGNETVIFNNYNEYLKFSEFNDRHGFLRAEKLELSQEFYLLDFDLFMISNYDQTIYISDLLRDALIESNISGFEILKHAALL